MWNLSVPWWGLVFRAVVVYVFLVILLRISGKRQVGQLSPFDLVLLLVLSNAVQNSINAGDNTITGGIISASTLVGLNYMVGWLTFRFKKIEAIVEGRPVVLIHHGKVIHAAMKEVMMTVHELNNALREEGVTSPEEVLIAVLENSGKITVIPRRHPHEK